MPEWVDLRAHGLTLLALHEPTGDAVGALVIRRLRPDAELPIAAVTYGFVQRGSEFVRQGPNFSLSAIQRLFPKSRVADLPAAEIAYRRSATIVSLHPERSALPQSQQVAAANAWARIPLPRFQIEATTAWEGGRLLVLHGQGEYQTQRRDDPAAAKAEAHQAAVSRALADGIDLPLEVLVDYADNAYWGARHGHAAVRATHLLSRLGVTEKLLRGDSGYLVLHHPYQPALHIERIALPDGVRVAFTHFHGVADAPSVQREAIFTVNNGRLFLAETAAIDNDGIQVRGFDTHFANAFLQDLLTSGYEQARVSWPAESLRNSQHPYGQEVQRLLQQHAAAIMPIHSGAFTGLHVAAGPDADGRVQLAMGVSAHAAITALAARRQGSDASGIRQLGMNLFREVLIEDGASDRHRLTQDGPVAEHGEGTPRGVEFMTVAEGQEIMALSRKSGRPTLHSWLFGRQITRVVHGSDSQPMYFSIQDNGAPGLVHCFVPHAATQVWECISPAWAAGIDPTDAQLQASYTRAVGSGFNSDAFLLAVNNGIRESNEGLDTAYRLPELSPEQFMVTHPNATTYILQYKDPMLPLSVAIEADGDLWRVCTNASKFYPTALGSACSSAAGRLANERMQYLQNLHAQPNGTLRIGLPQADFESLRRWLQGAADPAMLPWPALGPKLPAGRLALHVVTPELFQLQVKEMGLSYDVFVLALDPNSTTSNFERAGVQSVAQLLEQVQGDIAWAQLLQQRPDAALLQSWVERYLDMQIRHYSSEHMARVPGRQARELSVAIADRDVDVLLRMVGRNETGHACADKLFHELSGCRLGESAASRQQAIYTYCGYDQAAAAQHQQGLDGQAVLREQAEQAGRVIRDAQAFRCSHEGREISGRAYVDQIIADGYRELEAEVRAAGLGCRLRNEQTGQTVVLRGALAAYAKQVLLPPEAGITDAALVQPASNR